MIQHEPIVIYLRVMQLMIQQERGVVVNISPPQSPREVELFEKVINSPKFLDVYYSLRM